MKPTIYSTPHLATNRLREEYILPKRAALDPKAVFDIDTPVTEHSKLVEYHVTQAEASLRRFRAEPEERKHLLEVMTHCEVLRRLGYTAKASMRLPLVSAFRGVIEESPDLVAALNVITLEALNDIL